jgi:hypothetical protein
VGAWSSVVGDRDLEAGEDAGSGGSVVNKANFRENIEFFTSSNYREILINLNDRDAGTSDTDSDGTWHRNFCMNCHWSPDTFVTTCGKHAEYNIDIGTYAQQL